MSSVKRFVSDHLSMKLMEEDMEQSKVRFSVTLPPEVNRRLEYCAKELNYSRSGLANVLIEKALNDVEDVLGLKFQEDGQMTEYAKFVYGASAEQTEKEVS